MKGSRAGQVAVAALLLVIAGAAGGRLLRASSPASGASPSDRPSAAATSSAGTFRAAPDTPAANLTVKLSEMMADEFRRPPASLEDELAKSRARDAQALGRDLKDLLAREPALWRSVFDVMDADALRVSRRITPMIRDAVDGSTEEELIGKLHGASRQDTRRLALDLLCGRTSGASLSAVAEAVRRDPDPGLRYAALLELAMRKGSAPSPDAIAQIDQAIQERAQVDASLEIRQAALRITGRLQETPPKAGSASGFAGRPRPSRP